jgi:deaminated glutathione amidase
MPEPQKMAMFQMNSGIDPAQNAARLCTSVSDAAQAGAKMLFAPEMSLLLDKNRARAAPNIRMQADNTALAMLCRAAADNAIWLHMGSVPIKVADGDGKFANRSFIINDKGVIVASYDKIHLFDVDLATGEAWRESSAYSAGNKTVLVDTPIGRLGLSICYDMRFSALFAEMAKAGATVFAVPSAFTVPTGKAHWHTLLRARAIESAAFVIAAAQSGKHEDGRETYGHSLVIDPWGDVLLDMGEGEGLGFAEIDLARVEEVRAQIPVHLNRREIPPIV